MQPRGAQKCDRSDTGQGGGVTRRSREASGRRDFGPASRATLTRQRHRGTNIDSELQTGPKLNRKGPLPFLLSLHLLIKLLSLHGRSQTVVGCHDSCLSLRKPQAVSRWPTARLLPNLRFTRPASLITSELSASVWRSPRSPSPSCDCNSQGNSSLRTRAFGLALRFALSAAGPRKTPKALHDSVAGFFFTKARLPAQVRLSLSEPRRRSRPVAWRLGLGSIRILLGLQASARRRRRWDF